MNPSSTTIEVPLSADEISHLVRVLEDRQANHPMYDDVKLTEALIMVRLLLCLRHAQGQAK